MKVASQQRQAPDQKEVFSDHDDASSMRVREPEAAAFGPRFRAVGNC